MTTRGWSVVTGVVLIRLGLLLAACSVGSVATPSASSPEATPAASASNQQVNVGQVQDLRRGQLKLAAIEMPLRGTLHS